MSVIWYLKDQIESFHYFNKSFILHTEVHGYHLTDYMGEEIYSEANKYIVYWRKIENNIKCWSTATTQSHFYAEVIEMILYQPETSLSDEGQHWYDFISVISQPYYHVFYNRMWAIYIRMYADIDMLIITSPMIKLNWCKSSIWDTKRLFTPIM